MFDRMPSDRYDGGGEWRSIQCLMGVEGNGLYAEIEA